MSKGVELGVKAARKALEDWGGDLKGITHLGESAGEGGASEWVIELELIGFVPLGQFVIPVQRVLIRESARIFCFLVLVLGLELRLPLFSYSSSFFLRAVQGGRSYAQIER